MRIFLTLIITLLFLNSFAAKFAGGDLTYKNLSGNNYEITLSGYFDCSGGNPPNNQPIFFECSSNPSLNFDTVLNLITNSTSQTFPSTCNTVCNGGSEFGVKEFIYKINIQIPSCSDWLVSCSGSSWTPIDITIGVTNWYLHFKLNNSLIQSSSPTFANSPIIFTCLNTMNCYNPQIIDNTGDSLVLDLACPMSGKNQTIILVPPYSCSNILISNPPLTFNYLTGEICFAPLSNTTSFTCLKIEKWRIVNGQPVLLGVIHRNLYFKTYSCSNNQPVLSGMDFTNSGIYSSTDTIFHKEIHASEPCEFSINGFDADTFSLNSFGSPEKFLLDWDSAIQQASFQKIADSSNHASALFSWTPGLTDISSNHKIFETYIKDLYCPVQGFYSKKYYLTVLPPFLNLGNDTTLCINQHLTLKTDSGTFQYLWSTGDTTNSIHLDSINLSIGVNAISLIRIGYGFIDYDTIFITLNPCLAITDKSEYPDKNIIIYPNPTNKYLYIKTELNHNQTTDIHIFNMSGVLVFSKQITFQNLNYLDISQLKKGIHLFRISNENGLIYSEKLIVE